MEDIRPGQVSRWRTNRAQCGGIPYARPAGNHSEDICHRAGQKTRWHPVQRSLTIKVQSGPGFLSSHGQQSIRGGRARLHRFKDRP